MIHSAEKFVRTWQASSSTKDAAERLGVSISAARERARKLRLKGVPLRRFGNHPIDSELLDRLKAIAVEADREAESA